MLINRSTKPIYGRDGDFFPGFNMFTAPIKDPNLVSTGIFIVQNEDEELWFAELLKKYYGCEGLSHVVGVEDETYGIEASTKGIQRCLLSDYLDDPKMLCIFREPVDLRDEDIKIMLNHARSLIGGLYDGGTFPGFAVQAYTHFQDLFPIWRKLPMTGHVPGARVCSSLWANCFQQVEKYRALMPYKGYHYSRIHVNRHWNSALWKPLRFDKAMTSR